MTHESIRELVEGGGAGGWRGRGSRPLLYSWKQAQLPPTALLPTKGRCCVLQRPLSLNSLWLAPNRHQIISVPLYIPYSFMRESEEFRKPNGIPSNSLIWNLLESRQISACNSVHEKFAEIMRMFREFCRKTEVHLNVIFRISVTTGCTCFNTIQRRRINFSYT